MAYQIFKKCDTCGGDGVAEGSGYPPGGGTCWHCGGAGRVMVFEVDDLDDAMADILDKLKDCLEQISEILKILKEKA